MGCPKKLPSRASSGHLCVRPPANLGLHLSFPPRGTYVCVCTCVCACVCVCACLFVYAYLCVCVCVYIHTHTHICMYVYRLAFAVISRSPFLSLARSFSRSLALPRSPSLSLSLSPPRLWWASALSADACEIHSKYHRLSLRLSRFKSGQFCSECIGCAGMCM